MLDGRVGPTLSDEDCWRLLGAGGVGRLAVTTGALPTILPVRYEVADRVLHLCLGTRPALARSVDGTVVAFEVDSLAPDGHDGWWVHVNGPAELVPAPELGLRCGEQDDPVTATLSPTLLSGGTYEVCGPTVPSA